MSEIFVCNGDEARYRDAQAIHHYHIPSLILMEHAAIASIEKVKWTNPILILCGPGNNGGDGLAIARLLFLQGHEVYVFAPAPEKMSADEKVQWDAIKLFDFSKTHNIQQAASWIEGKMVVDCLFGNGLNRPILGEYSWLIDQVNASDSFVVSIDVPSGLHATSGKKLGNCIHANQTIALDCIKRGHLIQNGPQCCQHLDVVDIGIPKWIRSGFPLVQNIKLPKRNKQSHKGTFGKALMVGGSSSMHGAITMACMACFRCGIGTLTTLTPDSIQSILALKMEYTMNLCAPTINGNFSPEAITILQEIQNRFDILTIGNGMGQNDTTKNMVSCALNSKNTVLIDADGCHDIDKEALRKANSVILTPHIKEMTYLVDKSIQEILDDPFSTVSSFCQQYPNCTLVLKGAMTLIGNNKSIYVHYKPNSALAKGGSGDILCGMIAGLFGQLKDPLQACIAGVYLHSQCADIKKDPACILPQDLFDQIEIAISKMREA